MIRNNTIRKAVFLAVMLAMILSLCACGKTKTAQSTQPAAESAKEAVETFTKVRHAEITVKDYGTIKLELDEGTAPITVENFIKLAKDGFYDGLTFHRLDGSYAAFGRVTEGQEVADQIAKDAKPVDNNGTIPAAAQPVIEKIIITD